MNPSTAAQLLEINRTFYAAFGAAFAATRRRIQEGVGRVLDGLPDDPAACWLDIGCGSGSVAAAWLRRGRASRYLGVDFSAPLLAEARQSISGMDGADRVAFQAADLGAPGWADSLPGPFSGVLAFAVLHHIPSQARRVELLREAAGLLRPGGRLVHSEWQFQNSPKLMERRVPWQTVGIDERDLEPGDTLLDWRYTLPGQPEQTGLRYVHLFERAELAELAQSSGFRVLDEFESDGQGGRLGLYQVWEKVGG